MGRQPSSSVNARAAAQPPPEPAETPQTLADEPDVDPSASAAAVPGDSMLIVIDLAAGTSVSIPWLSEPGPSYATFF